MEQFIYHIVKKDSWNQQRNYDAYKHESLLTEGFIHCCALNQIDGVLDRYFEGIDNLLALKILTVKVKEKIIVEKAPNGMYFPHIYGPLNKDAIIDAMTIR